MRFSEFNFLTEAPRTPRPGLQRQQAQQQAQQQAASQQQAAPGTPAYIQQQQAAQAQQQAMQYQLHGGSQPDATDAAHINSWAQAIQDGSHQPSDVPDVYQSYVQQVVADQQQKANLTAPKQPGFLARTFTTKGAVAARAQQIFLNNFQQKLQREKDAVPPGQKFDYQNFADAYLARNKWSPGTHKLQLDSAIQRQSDLALGQAMAKIGQANTMVAPRIEMPGARSMLGIPH
jgi:hypothetical protein